MYFGVLLQYFFAVLFLLTGLDKLIYWKKHKSTMKLYKILPEWSVTSALLIFSLVELSIGGTLLIKGITALSITVITGLLVTYTIAISINLLRGNTDINCGCGSLLESNHLHIGLVARNSLLILMSILLYFLDEPTIQLPIILKVVFTLISFSALILMNVFRISMNMSTRMNQIYKTIN